MNKRIVGVLTVAVLVASACSSAATTAAPTGTTAPSSSAGGKVEITGTTYKATAAAHTGGSVVIAEWQSPGNINAYYAQAETDVEAGLPALGEGLVNVDNHLGYIPDIASKVPVLNDGVTVNSDGTWTSSGSSRTAPSGPTARPSRATT